MIPLLIIPVIVYNLIAGIGVPLSYSVGAVSIEEVLLIITLALLAFSMWQSAVPSPTNVKKHVANLILTLVCVFEIAVAPWCQTGAFFALLVAVVVDTTLGSYLTLVNRGRNVWISKP